MMISIIIEPQAVQPPFKFVANENVAIQIATNPFATKKSGKQFS